MSGGPPHNNSGQSSPGDKYSSAEKEALELKHGDTAEFSARELQQSPIHPLEKTASGAAAARSESRSAADPVEKILGTGRINYKTFSTKDEVLRESARRSFLDREKFGKSLSRNLKDLPAGGDRPAKSREFVLPRGEELDAAANAGLFFPIGLRQHFQLRKSEFKKIAGSNGAEDVDRNLEKIRPELLDFLAQSPVKDDKKLTSAERAGLYESREALLAAGDLDEALSNALHLARLYQHLRYIEEAKRATYLALGIDPDNQLGKQLLKELERVHPVDIFVHQTVPQSQVLTKAALKNRILNLSGGKVCVVGDLLIDELVEGRPERISREAPVLILEHVDSVLIPGGAANTAHNVSALNGKCHAVGVCGRDDYAPKLARLLEDHGISHTLIEDDTRPTTIKTRIVSKSHALMQQLLRIDRISHQKVSAAIEAKLIEAVESAAEKFNAIILSDYKSGVITDGVINAVRKCAAKRNTMVIVDAQGVFERFAACTLMTPNQPDAEAAAGFKITSRQSLQTLGETLLQKSGVKALLVTRGGDGMVLFEQGKPMFELPAFNRSEVFDVTGAGDTVVATMALALTSGASLPEAMALGNLAASIVVRKPGTEVTSQKEMLEHLELLHLPD
ncbi:MAG: bifunctional hydroxymethylpyrimidine kinase/phosphomethylpyrimidine kinase [Cyanobacteria bacterium REEB67]|nr:bifunctional hydroxymethylpyrimidine kinase/phosphomethylpyrimidine kinase [Cyanobacteria bacterium REEB67]